MKKLLYFLTALILVSSFASGQKYSLLAGRYEWRSGWFDSTLRIPHGPIPVLGESIFPDEPGAIFYNTTDSFLYVFNGSAFMKVRGIGDAVSGGSSGGSGAFYNFTSPLQNVAGNVTIAGWNKPQWDSVYSWWKTNPLNGYATQSWTQNYIAGKFYLTKSQADSLYASAGKSAPNYTNGLFYNSLTNEVGAYYNQPMWNASYLQGRPIEAIQPKNFTVPAYDSLNNVIRWLKPDSLIGFSLDSNIWTTHDYYNKHIPTFNWYTIEPLYALNDTTIGIRYVNPNGQDGILSSAQYQDLLNGHAIDLSGYVLRSDFAAAGGVDITYSNIIDAPAFALQQSLIDTATILRSLINNIDLSAYLKVIDTANKWQAKGDYLTPHYSFSNKDLLFNFNRDGSTYLHADSTQFDSKVINGNWTEIYHDGQDISLMTSSGSIILQPGIFAGVGSVKFVSPYYNITDGATHYLSILPDGTINVADSIGSITPDGNNYVTGGSYSSGTLTLNRNGGLPDITISGFGSGSGAVSSVFGRTGAVAAQSGDYTFAQIGSKPTTLSGYGITDIPLSADASTNKYLNWNGSTYARKQIDYSELSGKLPVTALDIPFGGTGGVISTSPNLQYDSTNESLNLFVDQNAQKGITIQNTTNGTNASAAILLKNDVATYGGALVGSSGYSSFSVRNRAAFFSHKGISLITNSLTGNGGLDDIRFYLGGYNKTADLVFKTGGRTIIGDTIDNYSGNSHMLLNVKGSAVVDTLFANVVSTPNSVTGSGSTYTFTSSSIVNTGNNLTLSGDNPTPGNSYYYGTNSSGVKGFYVLPTGSGGISTPTVTTSSASTLTLSSSDYYVYTGSTATTWALPASNSKPYVIKNRGSGTITLNGSLYTNAITSSINILPGDAYTVIWDGTYYLVF